MGRTTQFIGLNKAARDLVETLTEVTTDRQTYGMFDEPIPLQTWEHDGVRFEEVVQISPWSGGPMIFTHLLIKKADAETAYFGSWVYDRSLEYKQYDFNTGVYKV